MTRVPKNKWGAPDTSFRVASWSKGKTYHTAEKVDCNRGLTTRVSLDTARQFGMKPCRKCLKER